jgi:hypothetical protein
MRAHVKSCDEAFGPRYGRLENGKMRNAAIGVSRLLEELEEFWLTGPT